MPARLKYTGEPAEKVQGSKVVHGLRGYYDGVDAIVSFHPFYMLPLCNTARWDTQCGSYYSKVYTFVCDEPETWQLSANPNSPIPASHSAARAPGANVALMSMYTSSRIMQDAMLPSFGGWSLSDAIFTQGQATADNLPARIAQIQYSWRCPTLEMAEHVLTVLDRNAEHAAAMAHCRLETTWVARNRPGRTNHVTGAGALRQPGAGGRPAVWRRGHCGCPADPEEPGRGAHGEAVPGRMRIADQPAGRRGRTARAFGPVAEELDQ